MEPTDEKIAIFQEFYKELGINKMAEEAIEKNYYLAMDILKEMNLTAVQKTQLQQFATSLIKRIK